MFAQSLPARCILFSVAVLGALVEVAHAVPIMRDVYVPHVTYPSTGAVWHPGQTYKVIWYVVSDGITECSGSELRLTSLGTLPTPRSRSLTRRARFTSARGNTPRIVSSTALARFLPVNSESAAILAKDFSITSGYVEFTLPKVENGGDYRVVCECLTTSFSATARLTLRILVFGDSGNFSDEFSIME